MLEIRTKVIIIVVAGVTAMAVILGGFFWFSRDGQKAESEPALQAPIDSSGPEVKIAPPTAEEKQAASVGAVVKTFVERFGSFSNQSGYLGLTELTPLTTDSFNAWLTNSYLPKLKKTHATEGYYYEISTVAAVLQPVEQSADKAKFLVTTQRAEQSDKTQKAFQQDIIVELKAMNNEWRVDGAYWQNVK